MWLPGVDAAATAAPPTTGASSVDPVAARVEAQRRVDEVAENPEGGYRLRAEFYHLGGRRIAHLGGAELAFLRWEIRRGVLRPIAAGGSAWWRAVNRDLLVAGEEARVLHEAGAIRAATPDGQRWLDFLGAPSPASWYRAHNACIVHGYLEHEALARDELPLEQHLLTVVLTRVLFAHAMVDPPPRRGGHLEEDIERLVADPGLPAVDVLVHLADFYPERYPLIGADATAVLDRLATPEGLLARLFDHEIERHQRALYQHAAKVLDAPGLLELAGGDEPRYPS